MNTRHPLVGCVCAATVFWCNCDDQHAARRVIVACERCNGRRWEVTLPVSFPRRVGVIKSTEPGE